jgi:hypothetical protein
MFASHAGPRPFLLVSLNVTPTNLDGGQQGRGNRKLPCACLLWRPPRTALYTSIFLGGGQNTIFTQARVSRHWSHIVKYAMKYSKLFRDIDSGSLFACGHPPEPIAGKRCSAVRQAVLVMNVAWAMVA